MVEHDIATMLLGGLLGLLVGSFLNVVIYRMPKILERQWAQECAELTGQEIKSEPAFNLMVPRSRCQKCGHLIRWYENIPVLSYLFLGGKCSSCKTGISLRYPAIELVTGGLFAWCAWQWGTSATAVAWCVFTALLLALAMIDWDTTFLPDDMTLPLLWAGLLASSMQWTAVPLSASVWGAIAGYLSLWLVYWGFKLLTGREGMGYGDFKLLAALGAWFGWQALVPIILMSSVIGAVIGIVLKFSNGLREGGYVPFGPFLAGAGFTAMLFGPQTILRVIGL
jgi:leader peptidase (prepilin peptidase)/N-methyltransferase